MKIRLRGVAELVSALSPEVPDVSRLQRREDFVAAAALRGRAATRVARPSESSMPYRSTGRQAPEEWREAFNSFFLLRARSIRMTRRRRLVQAFFDHPILDLGEWQLTELLAVLTQPVRDSIQGILSDHR